MENEPHKHGPGCGCAGYELSNEDDNLWEVIDHDNIQCLNENNRESCRKIFRPTADLLNFGTELHSPEDDPELVLIIPFKEEVRVRCIQLVSTNNVSSHPETAGLYMNEENVSFDITDDLPAQELNLSFGQTHNFPHNFCEAEVNIKKFTNVQKLIVHLVSQEQIQLKYFAVKGIR